MLLRFGIVCSSLLLWSACAGVAPDPQQVSIDSLPVVALDDELRARVAEFEQAAIDAVMRRRYQEAEALARRVLATDPRSARARAVLGMVELQEAARQDPIEWFGLRRGESQLALARQLAPEDAFVGWMHAVFLAESGHMSAAAVAAEEALQRAAEAPAAEKAALLGIAGTYRYELGEERAALPHLRTYVSLRPDDATAQFRLGASLLSVANTPQGVPPPYRQAQSDAEQAARAFASCYELAPGDEDAALSVATAMLRAAELARMKRAGDGAAREQEAANLEQSALEHLKQVADRFADSAEARFRLGVVAARLGQPELARASYLAALERDGDHAGSLMNLAALAVERGEQDQARGLLRQLLAADEARRELSRDERRAIERWLAGATPADK
ncbi:MAG: tetratricopeptide repeat protein [Planctomycetes bacterium]|nr:tetratricopeptide repeat protein [Planctomycetota bacterium]